MQVGPYRPQEIPVGSQYAGGVVKNVEYRVVDGGGSLTRPLGGSIARPFGAPLQAPPGALVPMQSYYPSAVGHPYPGNATYLQPAPQSQPAPGFPRDYPVDIVQPPFNHVPTGDGFTSPYEVLPQNLNRNPYYKSWYDVPLELRQTPKPPSDFVISQHDPDFFYLQNVPREAEAVVSRPAGISQFRFCVLGQRQEELKDNGPAVQMADFQVFDMENNPYPMQQFIVSCQSDGACDEGCEPERLFDGDPGTKFLRREFQQFPIDIEIDFGQPILIGSYSWRTGNDTPGRDPVSWQLQAFVKDQWIVVDEVHECTVPKARYAQVGPFGLANVPYENVVASEQYSLDPPMHAPLYEVMDGGEVDQHQSYIHNSVSRATHQPATYARGGGTLVNQSPPLYDVPASPTGQKAPKGVNPQATIILHDILVQPNVDRLPARVQELLRKGADAVSPDTKGRTPLIKACRKGDPSVLTMLMDYGADVNARTHAGETALHRLALNGDVQCLETVLRAGGDPNLQDGQGDTALALATARADPASVALLLRAGGRADLKNFKNLSGLDMLQEETRRQGFETAAAREVRRLIGHGAGPRPMQPVAPAGYLPYAQ